MLNMGCGGEANLIVKLWREPPLGCHHDLQIVCCADFASCEEGQRVCWQDSVNQCLTRHEMERPGRR